MTDNDTEAATAPNGTGDDAGTAEDSPVEDAQVAALDALGNEHRLEILLALADRQRETRIDRYELSFTELYEAVDVESTSQFSYHLSQLVGPFVAETDGGYHLTYGGEKIVRAIRSGVYETAVAFDPVDVDGRCLACDASALEALLADERFVVRCRDCERRLLSDSFPRSQAADRTPAEVVESFGYRIWSTYLLVRGGVCPECYGRVERRVDSHASPLDSEPGSEPGSLYTFASVCAECDFAIHLPIEVPAAFHPAALGFLWRHGVSVLDLPLWEFFELLASPDWTTDVQSVDPFDARFRVEMGGETLAFSMDDSFAVSLVDHADAGPPT